MHAARVVLHCCRVSDNQVTLALAIAEVNASRYGDMMKVKAPLVASLTLKSSHYPRKTEIFTHTNDIQHSSASVFVYCLLVKSLCKTSTFVLGL